MSPFKIKKKQSNIVKIIFSINILLLLFPNVSFEKSNINCDVSLTGSKTDIYGYRFRTNRCEGRYEKPYFGKLELISATYGDLIFYPSKDKTASIIIPPLKKYKNNKIHICAKSMGLRTYYQMDTYVKPGFKFLWPISEVIHPLGITADKIGITGILNTGNIKEIIVPLIVQPGNSLTINNINKKIRIVLRSSLSIDQFYWAYTSLKIRNRSIQYTDHLKGKSIDAGQPIFLYLPQLRPGIYKINIRLKNTNLNSWGNVTYHIFCSRQ